MWKFFSCWGAGEWWVEACVAERELPPGARMTWVSQMTESSPTPQQQNRWKDRRWLAAALIPPPAACPPETSVALLPNFLRSELRADLPRSRSSSGSTERLLSQVVFLRGGGRERKKKKKEKEQKSPDRRAHGSGVRTQSRRRRVGSFSPPSWSRIAGRYVGTASAFMSVVWKVDSGSHSEVQQQEVVRSELRVPPPPAPAAVPLYRHQASTDSTRAFHM